MGWRRGRGKVEKRREGGRRGCIDVLGRREGEGRGEKGVISFVIGMLECFGFWMFWMFCLFSSFLDADSSVSLLFLFVYVVDSILFCWLVFNAAATTFYPVLFIMSCFIGSSYLISPTLSYFFMFIFLFGIFWKICWRLDY